MAINQISTLSDNLGSTLRSYFALAVAIQNQTGDLSMSTVGQLANAGHSAGSLALQLQAEIPRSPATATAKLADMGIESLAAFGAHMLAIQTAAAAFNSRFNAMATDSANVEHFALKFRPVSLQEGQPPLGMLKGPDKIPAAMVAGLRTSAELQALIDALDAAGAK